MNEANRFRLKPRLRQFAESVAYLPPSDTLTDKQLRDLYDIVRECAVAAKDEIDQVTGWAPETDAPATLGLPVKHLPALPPKPSLLKRLLGKK